MRCCLLGTKTLETLGSSARPPLLLDRRLDLGLDLELLDSATPVRVRLRLLALEAGPKEGCLVLQVRDSSRLWSVRNTDTQLQTLSLLYSAPPPSGGLFGAPGKRICLVGLLLNSVPSTQG